MHALSLAWAYLWAHILVIAAVYTVVAGTLVAVRKQYGPAIAARSPRVAHALDVTVVALDVVARLAASIYGVITGGAHPLAPPAALAARRAPPAGSRSGGMLLLLLGLVLVAPALHGCATTGTPSTGAPSWVSTARDALHVASFAVDTASNVLDHANPQPANAAETRQALAVARQAIVVAGATLDAYDHDQTATSRCRVYADIHGALAAAADVVGLLSAAGTAVPPVVLVAIDSLEAIEQAVAPDCTGPGARRPLQLTCPAPSSGGARS